MKLRVLDLFSGIGGFSLGLERTGGFETVAFCEIEPFPRRVLAKHWPEVPCYDDIRTLTADRLAADGIAVDVICGGFPCQDISIAGPGAGLDGARSGLWFEQVRLISELRPRVVILENVAELLGRGLGTVLGSLAEIGYNAEWECLPAAYVGARHIRDRIWIVAYPSGYRLERTLHLGDRLAAHVPNDWRATSRTPWPPDPEGWASESAFLGKDDDVSDWAQRIAALGNAVIPQIPELIGRAILQAVAA